MNYADFMEIDLSKGFGKPIIIGTRISVQDVLNWFAEGMTMTEIIYDFRELNEDQIKGCLAYATHKEHKLKIVSFE